MSRLVLISACLMLAAIGLTGEVLEVTPAPRAPVAPQGPTPASEPGARIVEPGGTFVVDVSSVRPQFEQLRSDERGEQIADWAMYGALLHSGLSSETVRKATYDKVPFRLPALEEVANFDYGSGRRLILDDGTVWLFRAENDPHPVATLGRLADQVRMELGEIPRTFLVFTYRSDLINGQIHLQRLPDVPGAELFSSAYGYVAATVSSPAEFELWIEQIDDVTHARLANHGGVELGGRRFPDSRSEGLDLEGVRTLYAAHKHLATLKRPQELVTAFSALVDSYNSRHSVESLARQIENVNALLRTFNTDAVTSTVYPSDRNYSTLRSHIEVLQDRVEAALRVIPPVPEEPGFSLDPQWDTEGLSKDLELVFADPRELIMQAYEVSKAARNTYRDDATPQLVAAAGRLLWMFHQDSTPLAAYESWADDVRATISGIRGKRTKHEQALGMVPLFKLRDTLAQDESTSRGQAVRLKALLDFVMAKHAFQCARYDGPLQGTPVGMTLFYTDLVAKTWAAVDYHRSAPTQDVDGFLSLPHVSPTIEPHYWEEIQKYPHTRLWFGLKRDGYAMTADSSAVSFAPIGTRVYAAGSNPVDPRSEVTPAEESRRVFAWWDRHYLQVANYEPQYHVLNQIMKWSVITGWLAKKHTLEFLNVKPAAPTLRFDRWFKQNPRLKFRKDVRFIPEARWPAGTECMERLISYPFQGLGGSRYIEGGVSLGSMRSLAQGSRISSSLELSLRRAGLDYGKTGAGALTNFKGTTFELSTGIASEASQVVMKVSSSARLRGAGVELRGLSSIKSKLSIYSKHGEIVLGTDKASLGGLRFEHISAGVRLEWWSGRMQHHAQLASQLLQANDTPLQAATQIASQLPAAPGRYVIETSRGTEVLLARGGSHGQVVTRFEVGEGAIRGAHLVTSRAAAGRPTWMAAVDEAGPGTLKGLNAIRWQKLRVHPARADSDVPGGVQRIFTEKGPGAAARRVKVRTASGELDGYVEDGFLYLRRPGIHSDPMAFTDLVTREQWSARYLRDLLEKVDDAAPAVAGRSAGVQAADAVLGGQPHSALRQLNTAARQGKLATEVQDFEGRLREGVQARLMDGERSAAAQLFSDGRVAAPDKQALQALEALPQQDLFARAQVAKEVVSSGARNRGDLLQLAESMERKGGDHRAIGDFIRAHADDSMIPSSMLRGRAGLRPSGRTVHSTLEIEGKYTAQTLSIAERQALARGARDRGLQIYVEDSNPLTKLDWDAAPGRTLSQVAKDPYVVWERLDVNGLGKYRPTELLELNANAFRREIPATASAPSAKGSTASSGRGTDYSPIYRIRPASRHASACDANVDGHVDPVELQRCCAQAQAAGLDESMRKLCANR